MNWATNKKLVIIWYKYYVKTPEQEMWWHSFAVLVDLLQSGKLSWQCCWQPVEEWSAERWIRSANEEHTPTREGNYLGCNSWGEIECDSIPRGVSHKITPELFMKRERLLQNVMTAVCHLQVSTQSMKWMLWKRGAIVAGNTFTVDKHSERRNHFGGKQIRTSVN